MRDSSYIKVTATSSGPPLSLDHAKDYISYSPASHLLTKIDNRPSRPTSPTARPGSPRTPSRLRRLSISSQDLHLGGIALSRASSRLSVTPGSRSLKKQASREDISEAVSTEDPRSVMTEEVLDGAQPSLGNMMEVLEKRASSPAVSGTPTLLSPPIRLAPPIWGVPGSARLSTDIKPVLQSDPGVSRATSPASDDALDPFHSSPVIAAPKFDKFQVPFPASSASSLRGHEDADNEIRLHEASSRSPKLQSGRSLGPMQGDLKQSPISHKTVKTPRSSPPKPTTQDESPGTMSETLSSLPIGSDTSLSKPTALRLDQTSLPRVLRPRLAINLAWDDMSVPSAITIASTESKPPNRMSNGDTPAQSQTGTETSAGPAPRNRTTSLAWATGVAFDTASGLAQYGLSFVPAPLRPKPLSQRRAISEYNASDP